MAFEQRIDRRKATYRTFRLGKPLFELIPKTAATPVLVSWALITIFTANAASAMWFGPIFLLICACGAWFVGNRFAVLLSLYIASIQYLSGNSISFHLGPTVMAVQFFTALAVVLMLGVARAALESEWRSARIDPLTGALNRQAFFEAVEDQRGQAGVALLVFADLDGLKLTNDRLGHEAGDEALRDFAKRIREGIRKDDIFARIGGDEFAIILRVRDTMAAELVAQRLNRLLNSTSPGSKTELKCSLGALVLPTGSNFIDAELKQADALMYFAKRERSGLMSAISGSAVINDLMPTVLSANSSCRQPQELRATRRVTEHAESPR